jgi:hypothetical protein
MISKRASEILSNRKKRLVEKIFRKPPPKDIRLDEIVSLVQAFGGKKSTKSGSGFKLFLAGTIYVAHRPHPENHMDAGAIESFCDFLITTGVYDDTDET